MVVSSVENSFQRTQSQNILTTNQCQ